MWVVVLGGGGMLMGCCHLSSLGAAISGVGLGCCLAFMLDGSGGLQQWWHYSGGGGYLVVVQGWLGDQCQMYYCYHWVWGLHLFAGDK